MWHLRGKCLVRQGSVSAAAHEAVLWVDRAAPLTGQPHKVLAYLEGDVSVDFAGGGPVHRETGRAAQTYRGPTWLGRFSSTSGIEVYVPLENVDPAVKPAVYERGMRARSPYRYGDVQQAQFTTDPLAAATGRGTPRVRRVTVTPRSSVRVQARTFFNPERNEQVAVIDSGVRVVIESEELADGAMPGGGPLGKITLETDRMVIWTANLQGEDGFSGESVQSGDTPLEFYLEGNIVFLQGDRVIYAQRMYYDVPRRFGVVLDAEVLAPIPDYQGLLRLKADVLQQLDEHNFQAYGAAATSSRLGVPRYWFQAENVAFQDIQTQLNDPFTGMPAIDPQTGDPAVEHQLMASSRNNFIYMGGVPVFYWPVLATDLTKPTYYLDRITIRSDSVFGAQLLTDWDMYQLLGIRNPPDGTRWTASLDLLSERGPAVGTEFEYHREGFLGIPGPYDGLLDAWAIDDHGRDNLGADRRSLVPPHDFRGRALWQHRHQFANDLQLKAELGLVSDGNFLEAYYEHDWDELKDETTGVELKKLWDDSSLAASADMRLNDFFTQTEWLPRVDHFVLGRSLLLDKLTWYGHSHIGYGRLETATTPTDPVDAAKFQLLAWEVPSEGIRAGTRQEIDLPLAAGPVKVVPFVLGDVTFWQEDLAGDDVTRFYGQAGVRASLPMWRADPTVQSVLLNLNGLAHKVSFDGEFSWAEADQDLSRFPLYDQVDDDAQEHFRRRFFFDTFGGMPGGQIPLPFDERFYALRSNMQGWVTAPSAEIADDLMIAKLGVRQRWQTKRGLPGHERVVDWIVFDVEGSVFPKPSRDNFGANVGLLNYEFLWHVGDRLTFLSDGYADTFSQGLRTFSVGGIISRPEQGNLYLGFRSLEGPISANILTGSLSYRMSEKWIATAGAMVDLGPTGNIGQSLSFTRIGESLLVRLGINVDASRGSVGAVVAIEPRFLNSSRLGEVGGVQIPPAGALGLE